MVPASGDRGERYGHRLRSFVRTAVVGVPSARPGRNCCRPRMARCGRSSSAIRMATRSSDLVPANQGRPVWHGNASHGPFLGIDHSALSIASTRRSLGFYRALGLRVSDRSLNHGPAQARLDGLAGARVRVTGLRPASAAGPGLELLNYRPPGRPAGMTYPNDVATDWVTLAVSPSPGTSPRAIRDPDGHRLVLVDHGAGATGLPA